MIAETNDISNKNIKDMAKLPSILLESPSPSEHRVTFDEIPKVKEISYNNGEPTKRKPIKFEIKDKTLILHKKQLKTVKLLAKRYNALMPSRKSIILKYKRNEDMEVDMRALGLKPKTYVENKIIIYGLSYKEDEDSIRDYFSKFSEVEKVMVEKNKKNFCTGKATVTFNSFINTNQEFRLNNRLLRIERIKKQIINRNRLFVSHMNKSIKISEFRKILKDNGFVPKDIRIDLQDGRNKGYGFVEFESNEDAERFIENFKNFSIAFGPESRVEKSKEKNMKK